MAPRSGRPALWGFRQFPLEVCYLTSRFGDITRFFLGLLGQIGHLGQHRPNRL
jgi:hypothetical protein